MADLHETQAAGDQTDARIAALQVFHDENPRQLSWEIFVAATAMLSLLIIVAYFVARPDSPVRDALYAIDSIICLIFLADVWVQLRRTDKKLAYLMKWGWLDIISSLPTFPVLRILRVGRIMRSVRRLHGLRLTQFVVVARANVPEMTVLATFFVVLVVVTISSLFIVSIESASPDANIVTGNDAVWWSFVTISTVGYGDRYPVTELGRAVATVVMFVGVSLFTVLTSFIASRFMRPNHAQSNDELHALRQELAEMKVLVQALGRHDAPVYPPADSTVSDPVEPAERGAD